MVHPHHGLRCLAALAFAPALLAQADFPARLAGVEAVLGRHYRGETLEAGQNRVNAQVDAYNAQVQARNEALKAAQAQDEQDRAPCRQLEADLAAQDKALGSPPAGADREALVRYNAGIAARNGLAARYNDLLASVQRRVEARDADLGRLDVRLEEARVALETEQKALRTRRDAYEAFCGQGGDVAFFTELNRLLADLRIACRLRPDADVQAALARARGYRLELARWAAAHQAAQPNGLVLVSALVGDEPCCFIVDTGAQMVCLPVELIEALGLTGSLGEDVTHTLAGGQKLRGRSITFPRVAAAGMAAQEVAGSVLPVSDVGIDGLLGQSFLKRFVYTIDEGRPGKLILASRPGGTTSAQ